jgi:alpha-glucuronidase
MHVSAVVKVRLINHWSQWRGFPFDAWCMQSQLGRGDSLFSWHDLRQGGNATSTISDWARLLASVRINALAPQDVNWDERDDFLQHLDGIKVLGSILRSYGIRLYWTQGSRFVTELLLFEGRYLIPRLLFA